VAKRDLTRAKRVPNCFPLQDAASGWCTFVLSWKVSCFLY